MGRTTTQIVPMRGTLDAFRDAARDAVEVFRTAGPDEVELEFGIKYTASGTAVLSQESSAHMTVRLAWRRGGGEPDLAVSPTGREISLPTEVDAPDVHPALVAMAEESVRGEPDQDSMSMLIYLDGEPLGPEVEFRVAEAVGQVVGAFDLTVEEQRGPVRGSLAYWFRARRRDLRAAAGTELGKEVTVEVKRALQLRAVDAEQAKVDDAKAQAVAKLIAAVDAVPTAVIHSGALLLVKTNNMLTVRDLTPTEIDYLRRNPHAVADPATVLTQLQVITAAGAIATG